MKVIIDCHVNNGIFQGTRTVLENSLPLLIKNQPDIDFGLLDLPEKPALDGNKNVQFLSAPFKRGSLNYLWGFKRVCEARKADIFHSQYIAPLFMGKTKTVVTIHDVLFLDFKQYFPLKHSTMQRIALKHTSRNADMILTVSEYTKNRLLYHDVVRDREVIVIPNGVNASFYASKSTDSFHRIPKAYILYVGRIAPIKNIASIVEAFQRLKKGVWKSFDIQLVICGSIDPVFRTRHLLKEYHSWKQMTDVTILEGLCDISIRTLYQNAKCFVFLSEGEGFGLPILEAMAAGTPVIASNTTSLPEIAGDAALLVNPHDKDEVSAALQKMVEDYDFANHYRVRGMERIKLFSWLNYASKLCEVYDSLAGGIRYDSN